MRVMPQIAQRLAVPAVRVARRLDPYFRPTFDRWLQPPIENLTQWAIRRQLKPNGLALGEERIEPSEVDTTERITEAMNRFLKVHYENSGKPAERAGNTKTYGVVRAQFRVEPDLPPELRVGVFRNQREFPAYVRFSGPGPLVTPDIDNNGILSIGVKLMDVSGRKLISEERRTQDFLGISSPTFTTPTATENLKLQREIGLGTPVWYFLNPRDPHWLDAIMQGLYAKTHANPLELTYHSCVPYRFGSVRAIKYALRPRLLIRSRPEPDSDDYLREAMVKTLIMGDVSFDFLIQFQTDAERMPIEHAGVVWGPDESPFIKVASLDIPAQTFDSEAQLAFARNLAFNPWHSIAAHRPLGNQNRARKVIYQETARMRRRINGEPHIEPDGSERFDQTTDRPANLAREDTSWVLPMPLDELAR